MSTDHEQPKHVVCRNCLELVLGTKGAQAALKHDLVKSFTMAAEVKCCACDRPRRELYTMRADDRFTICAGARGASECGRATHAIALAMKTSLGSLSL